MNLENSRQPMLKILLLISVVITAVHFTDNFIYFEHYPQPDWITRPGVYRSWIIWTVFGIAGYWLYKNQRFWLSYLCLAIYSTCGLSSLGHYFFGAMHEFSAKMHLFILADGLAGLAILGFTMWSALMKREVRILNM